ncbi:hypothetical protein CA13_31270 [Planctomycetes bacterium CA13]|uniref:Uncharacterized protein n=1 Tax=Novipirellula herctigrandis TaxID=2527986 RepID=A0A5C5Z332_9BACT|nr:hypothetical protein CA13_31270 [Planctomycetes bacterium CA13]
MGIRKKGRAQFDFNGRPFVWWIEGDVHLRIASDDKRFIVGYLLIGDSSLLVVHGPEFPGIQNPERPLRIWVPPLSPTPVIGQHVNHILTMCFDGEAKPFVGESPEYSAGL